MIRAKQVVSAWLVLIGLSANAQSDLAQKVLFTVEDDTILAGEYMAVYNKNRNVGENIDPKTPEEYLDLYINFKLKVREAKDSGLAEDPNFRHEYQNYYDQLAKPYLTDKDKTSELVREAYRRSQEDVRVSHVMIKVPEGSRDTAAAYQTIQNLRQAVTQKGTPFEEVARENSQDTYSAKKGGDVGYFTAFNMVYPFESMAYKTKVGEVSPIFRSSFGYHFLKVTDRRPARGKIGVAHIMLAAPQDDEAKSSKAEAKIQEIYQQLEAGADFGTLARQYSDDKASAQQGGVLQPFGINRMYPSFEDASYALQNPGDYSEPVRTPVGWHLIKLERKMPLPSFEEMKDNLEQKVKRDARSQQSQKSVIKKLKEEYHYQIDVEVLNQAIGMVDDRYFGRKFEKPETDQNEKVLFTFADKAATVGEFMNFLVEEQMKVRQKDDLEAALYRAFDSFSREQLLDYEKTQLRAKYPEFRMLAREYYEGILLFNITNERIWQKASADTTGLKAYYQEHKDRYRWKKRYDLVLGTARSKKLAKKAGKMLKKGENTDMISRTLNESNVLDVSFKEGIYEEGELAVLEEFILDKPGLSPVQAQGENFQFVYLREILPAGVKTLAEARGAVLTDYQNWLEEHWLEELREAYEVQINDAVLKETIAILEAQS